MATAKKAAPKAAKPKPKTPAKKKAVARKPTPAEAEEKKQEKRNRQWEINNELISDAFFKSILANKKFPTYQAIATKLGLDEKTVRRHLQETEMFEDIKLKMKALKDKAMLTLAVKAIKGESHHWTRLFFEVTDEIKGKDNNITIFINGKPAGAGN